MFCTCKKVSVQAQSNTHTDTHTQIQAEKALNCELLSGCCCLWPADREKVEIQSVTLWQEPQVCLSVCDCVDCVSAFFNLLHCPAHVCVMSSWLLTCISPVSSSLDLCVCACRIMWTSKQRLHNHFLPGGFESWQHVVFFSSCLHIMSTVLIYSSISTMFHFIHSWMKWNISTSVGSSKCII